MEALLSKLYGWHGFLLIDQGFVSHLGWGFALPAVAYRLLGRWGLWAVSAAWIGYAFYREFVEELPEPTTWSDIVSRSAGAFLLVVLELVLYWRSRYRLVQEG